MFLHPEIHTMYMKLRLTIGLFSGVLLALSILAPGYSADAVSESQSRLLTDIKYLASDDLEGRGVGLKGLDSAADYIRDEFGKCGLKLDAVQGGPFQNFTMNTGSVLGPVNTLVINGPVGKTLALTLNTDFTTQSFGGAGAFTGDLVFCGYGIEAADKNYDDFAGIDLKGKVAIIMRRVPQQGLPNAVFPISGRGNVPSHGELRSKLDRAFAKGASGVLFVNDPYSGRQDLEKARKAVAELAEKVAVAAVEFEAADPTNAEKLAAARKKLTEEVANYKAGKGHLSDTEPDNLMKFGYFSDEMVRNIPAMHITRAVCDQILKGALNKTLADLEAEIDKEFKPQSVVLAGWNAQGTVSIERKVAPVKNVIAVLEGAGPHADETVVIGAHYDHVGRGGKGSFVPNSNEVHNGADDNASGAVSLLEVARRLSARKEKLPRRIVFIAFTGEEMGLIGSARYTQEPVFPLEKTIAMLNMDMVGRLRDDKLTIFGVGTSPVWEGMINRLAKDDHFELSLKPEGMGPSDHQSFFMKQVPVLHFFTGTHGDYHRPSDDWDKINIPGAERIVNLVEKIAVDVATLPERPEYIAVKGTAQIEERRGEGSSRPYFGSVPDFGGNKPGYLLGGVAPGGPAEKAGLKAGDRIIQLGKSQVENLADFDTALRAFSAGQTVEVVVMRGDERVTVKVLLEKPRGG
ncbi:MAG: M20/M25/M40 family metallo-hydrolase [Planctomycetes bacterium]|nr:M20/M25/M40 family metallo-hydrolase [Planctomycetota bacterium]